MVTKEEEEERKASQKKWSSCAGLWDGKAGCLWNTMCTPCVLCAKANEILCVPCMSLTFWRCVQPFHQVLCFCLEWPYEDGTFFGAHALGDGHDGEKSGVAMHKKTDWLRAHELEAFEGKRPQLFEGKIEAADLCQGALGDCWLVAALASAAEYPDSIRAAFLTKEYNPRGRYDVRLYDKRIEKFVVVTVDDRIPCPKGTKKPRFLKPNGSELWAIILEKAFAKLYGSYIDLDGGMSKNAWIALTGDYVHQFNRPLSSQTWTLNKEHRNENSKLEYDSDEMFRLLKRYTKTKALLAASAHPKTESTHSSNGLVASHAYSILEARDAVSGAMVGVGGTKFRLLRLRNPWGKFEWTGAWSDKSSLWDEFQDLKAELLVDDSTDGAFWISWADFSTLFDRIDLCDRNTRNDLSLNPREDDPWCGLCVGYCVGCTKFWCCCKGPATVYGGTDSSTLLLDASEKQASCSCLAARDGKNLEAALSTVGRDTHLKNRI